MPLVFLHLRAQEIKENDMVSDKRKHYGELAATATRLDMALFVQKQRLRGVLLLRPYGEGCQICLRYLNSGAFIVGNHGSCTPKYNSTNYAGNVIYTAPCYRVGGSALWIRTTIQSSIPLELREQLRHIYDTKSRSAFTRILRLSGEAR